MFRAKVLVKRRDSILDPQGKGVEQGAKLLGFDNISNIRIDKEIKFKVNAPDKSTAEAEVREFCSKLLANPIMEDFEITLEEENER